MMSKLDRPPVQCTVIRSQGSMRLPLLSDMPRTKGTLVTGPGVSIPAPIQAHLDKVTKMRIFDDEQKQARQQ